ncbi:helix-turn-helix domain-containing protein [Rhodobacter sp. KR11]|uniref:helix-turn-helix domain-containing protein n=1 Tax=Rhodobacter sp. KR11 TaxID=2974588 RepID=UPI0022218754|nr:helix-turn-helix transcriptional regulator [Rhodobacter sp. KR11]MCW1920844.1 helix-turn-helix domain-containing protein [Rhodobacter sp. KR11]
MNCKHPIGGDVSQSSLQGGPDDRPLPLGGDAAGSRPLVDGGDGRADLVGERTAVRPGCDQSGDGAIVGHKAQLMEEMSIRQDGKIFDWRRRPAAHYWFMEESSKTDVHHPSRVAPRIEAVRMAVGLNRSEFADRIDVDRSSFTKIADGKKPLLPRDAYKIFELWGVDMNFLYLGQIRDLPPSLSSKIVSHLKALTE